MAEIWTICFSANESHNERNVSYGTSLRTAQKLAMSVENTTDLQRDQTYFRNNLNWLIIPGDTWYVHGIYDDCNGPLARYVKLPVAHAPGMPGKFSSPPRVSDPDMHHDTCLTHVPWNMPESLNSGFLWSRWRGERSRHSRRMRNPQFYVSGKKPMEAPSGASCL